MKDKVYVCPKNGEYVTCHVCEGRRLVRHNRHDLRPVFCETHRGVRLVLA
jgi:hypothetical protein